MKIDITGRQIDVTPALKEFAEDKLRKLEKLLVEPLEAHVVLAITKHRHIAEIQVKSRHLVLSGTEETSDLYASIGEVVDKLERQALKHKEKVHDHKHRKSPRDPEIAAAISANASQVSAAESSDPEPAQPRIVRTRRYGVKPMSAEDAAMQLDASGEQLLVFREAETDQIQVLYRQQDGNFGLIEPDS